jgi:hypothetical protein
VETGAAARRRRRDLALAVALYPDPDLVGEGRRRVEEWNEQDARARENFARMVAPDMAMLETSPCLGAERIFARVAWLAYLSRHEPETYARPFLREWMMSRQYREYCGRTISYEIGQNKLEGARADLVRESWRDLSRRFGALQELSRPDVHVLLERTPENAAQVLKTARFTREIQTVRNLMGSVDPGESVRVLRGLRGAERASLAAFAAARLVGEPGR